MTIQLFCILAFMAILTLGGIFALGWVLMPYRKVIVMPEYDTTPVTTTHFVVDWRWKRPWFWFLAGDLWLSLSLSAMITCQVQPFYGWALENNGIWWPVALVVCFPLALLLSPLYYLTQRLGTQCAWLRLTRGNHPKSRNNQMGQKILLQFSTATRQKHGLGLDDDEIHPADLIGRVLQRASQLDALANGSSTNAPQYQPTGCVDSLSTLQADCDQQRRYLKNCLDFYALLNARHPEERGLNAAMFWTVITPIADQVKLTLLPRLMTMEAEVMVAIEDASWAYRQLSTIAWLLNAALPQNAKMTYDSAQENAHALQLALTNLKQEMEDLLQTLPRTDQGTAVVSHNG